MNDQTDDIDIANQVRELMCFIKLDELEAEALNGIQDIFDNKNKNTFEDISKLLVEWLKTTQSLQSKGLLYLNKCHDKLEHSEPIINWLKETHRLLDKNFDHLINIHEKLDNRDLTADCLSMGANSEGLALHCENLLDEVFLAPDEP